MSSPTGPRPPSAPVPAGLGPGSTRRRFLGQLGAAAATLGGVGLVAGCGRETLVAPTIVPLFSPDRVLVAGRPQRIPLAIVSPGADATGVAMPDDDEPITVEIARDGEVIDQVEVTGRVVDHDHLDGSDPDHQHADLFRYYPLRTTLPTPGIYDLTIGIGAVSTPLPIQAFDPGDVGLPLVGDPFPALSTPTVTDRGPVDRLCTRFEPCPFHEVTAAEALGRGRPLALLVATPAFCSTAYCGPVLETLIAATSSRDDLEVIHVEVYANPDEVGGNFADPAIRLVPAVAELGLTFEPSLFLVAADGVVADRIDNVFDRSELDEALQQLTT